ncbi:MAG TPA: cellulase family glycosylhydrolase [Rhabdochlamydiaceae bacterium]|nr:cellulase family glycosylhydrolase [Rhabdochlamydiaceae bacterium]
MKKMPIKAWITGVLIAMTMNAQAMTTKGNQILDSKGNPVQLKGVNWFGFNNGDTMVDGLWQTSNSIAWDFATVVYRMQLLGVNAVRLPFSFKDLLTEAPRSYSGQCTIPTQSQIQASVTDPNVPVPSGATIPPMVAPPARTAGMCDDYFPNDTTLNRFLWVVNFFAKNGFYVLIDNHFREDQTVLASPQQWVQDWVQLVTAISKDPVSKSMLMVDLLNEPDNFGVRWEASGSTPALTDLYLSVMDALYPINNQILFFIEGCGQGGIGCNWGDGFCTDPTLIMQNGLSDPNRFFQTLLTKPYLNQVVISPHVYPPTVTGQSTNYSGSGLWNRMSESFGYLTQKGYCSGTTPCKVFPVALGEFGSTFTDPRDLQSMPDIAAYLNNTGGAADGKHTAIPHFFYWAWNANSGDTGGLVANDWLTIQWNKVEYLTTIGLKPWYASNTPPPPNQLGTLCVNVLPVSGLPSQSLQPITAGPYTFSVANFNTPVCQSVNAGSYTVKAPEIIAGSNKFDATAQTATVTTGQTTNVNVTYVATPIPTTGNFTVGVQLGTPWQGSPGGGYQNVINLFITNTGTQAVAVPWKMAVFNSNFTSVTGFWNLNVNSVSNGTINATASSNWEVLEPNSGNTINVGMIVSSSTNNFMPTTITINGVPCTIKLQ